MSEKAKNKNNIKNKIKIILIALICITIIISIGYINYMKNSDSTIGDIAYDRNRFVNNIVYLKENNKYVPYIVVTNNYQGNTLLLRKQCLENSMYISDYYSYYENCFVDTYLNTEFLERFSENLKEKFVSTNIEIIAEDSIGISGTKTININRKSFLLSATEIGINILEKEGKELKYFKNADNRLANDSLNQHTVSYWLRTPETYNSSTTYVLTKNNQLSSTNSSDVWKGIEVIYVRPAICINSDTKIEKNSFIVKGLEVYVVSE